MFSPTNAHTLYPNCTEAISFDSPSIWLHQRCIRVLVGAPVYKPRFPEHRELGDQAIKTPRLKTAPEKTKKASCKGGNNTSSDILCLMGSLGFTVTPDIYACLIDECIRKGDAYRASELWTHMKRNKPMMRFLSKTKGLFFLNRILIMFMSCGSVEAAHQLFDRMSRRDTTAWCLMIAGLVDNSLHCEALDLFSQMMLHPMNHQNDAVLQILFACVLKACIYDMNLDLGRTLHGWAIKLGYIRNLHVSTSFLDFYSKFRCPQESNLIFNDQIQENNPRAGDTVFWTGAIVSNCQENHFQETIFMFREMGRAGIRKNEFTFSSVLRACGRIQDGGFCAQQAHADAIKHGVVESHVFVQCSLVDMYSKCGKLIEARKVFDKISCEMRNQSNPCWNAMINGYLENGLYVEAIKTLYQMKAAGVEPQESLLGRIKIACGTNKELLILV